MAAEQADGVTMLQQQQPQQQQQPRQQQQKQPLQSFNTAVIAVGGDTFCNTTTPISGAPTPELVRSQSLFGDSDDESTTVHQQTPSDTTQSTFNDNANANANSVSPLSHSLTLSSSHDETETIHDIDMLFGGSDTDSTPNHNNHVTVSDSNDNTSSNISSNNNNNTHPNANNSNSQNSNVINSTGLTQFSPNQLGTFMATSAGTTMPTQTTAQSTTPSAITVAATATTAPLSLPPPPSLQLPSTAITFPFSTLTLPSSSSTTTTTTAQVARPSAPGPLVLPRSSHASSLQRSHTPSAPIYTDTNLSGYHFASEPATPVFSAALANPSSSSSSSSPHTPVSNVVPLVPSVGASQPKKRGRPRKHPLPDPNAIYKPKPPPKRKAPPAAQAVAARKKLPPKENEKQPNGAAADVPLSVPDLGRLIPQESTSETAQVFIKNNVKLFADLFVALQKQANSDRKVRQEARAHLQGFARSRSVEVFSTVAAWSRQNSPQAERCQSAPAPLLPLLQSQPTTPKKTNMVDLSSHLVPVTTSFTTPVVPPSQPSSSLSSPLPPPPPVTTSQPVQPSSPAGVAKLPTTPSTISSNSNHLRNEVKKRMAEVASGHESLREEMLKLKVDMQFFDNAHKTVDDRIKVLRARIAARGEDLQREKESNRKAREATKKVKKDKKAAEKSLREAERLEKRLEQQALEIDRELAREEEERQKREATAAEAETEADGDEEEEEDEGDDEEEEQGEGEAEEENDAETERVDAGQVACLSDHQPLAVTTTSAETDLLVSALLPTSQCSTSTDRAVSLNDEELAKMLGISVEDLVGLSNVSSENTSAIESLFLATPTADLLATESVEQTSTDPPSPSFDLAAFLELGLSATDSSVAPIHGQPTSSSSSS